MADAWLPGAGRLQSRHNGGSLQGGAPRAVWHTSENDPLLISARSVAQHMEQRGRNSHLVWNPFTGDIVQMVPATRPALLLPHGVGREGRRCLQIVVIGFASEPFTDGAMKGIETIMDWLDLWGVPRRWPAGPPLPPPEAYAAGRERRQWARGGHFGLSQVPHAEGAAPGAIDTELINGVGRPAELQFGTLPLPGTPESLRTAALMPEAVETPPRPAPVRASSPT